ncbi:uncharacterized protein CYBJADRAFT_53038 [Cyberlindnera jadinii NRRL Y-1542]|uniref:Uncharacterized protein n=1 Tax=Cyberlindnera jadinii (strain ATCC 18201 / CBS 1600 / BCRC 20928 / JCM 3617 / NBRC 0987 / NRRL Y-1542) TaxID=983966 RepID=A0A1E4RVH7_CYBJN|nr:hypothetical protein CYBJADRAFT_53038 [Cyberlindnera jadinii NRRL Y-1542]ODV71075.1 hypothetical protein CYBJADRAFT_53038 [Cyberlindnera jadinii NRRL Y-1542]
MCLIFLSLLMIWSMKNLLHSTVVTTGLIEMVVSGTIYEDNVVIVDFIADLLSGYQWIALVTVIVNALSMIIKKRDTEECNLKWRLISVKMGFNARWMSSLNLLFCHLSRAVSYQVTIFLKSVIIRLLFHMIHRLCRYIHFLFPRSSI